MCHKVDSCEFRCLSAFSLTIKLFLRRIALFVGRFLINYSSPKEPTSQQKICKNVCDWFFGRCRRALLTSKAVTQPIRRRSHVKSNDFIDLLSFFIRQIKPVKAFFVTWHDFGIYFVYLWYALASPHAIT